MFRYLLSILSFSVLTPVPAKQRGQFVSTYPDYLEPIVSLSTIWCECTTEISNHCTAVLGTFSPLACTWFWSLCRFRNCQNWYLHVRSLQLDPSRTAVFFVSTNPILHILLTSYNDPLINRLKMRDSIQTHCHMCANVYFAAGKRPHVRPPCFYMNFSNVTTAHASTIIEHKMMRTYIVLIGSRSHFDWLKYSFPSSLHSLTRISKWGLADRLANPEKKVRHHTAISERVLPIFFSDGRHLSFIRATRSLCSGLGLHALVPHVNGDR